VDRSGEKVLEELGRKEIRMYRQSIGLPENGPNLYVVPPHLFTGRNLDRSREKDYDSCLMEGQVAGMTFSTRHDTVR
jgi:hypothetical protein